MWAWHQPQIMLWCRPQELILGKGVFGSATWAPSQPRTIHFMKAWSRLPRNSAEYHAPFGKSLKGRNGDSTKPPGGGHELLAGCLES